MKVITFFSFILFMSCGKNKYDSDLKIVENYKILTSDRIPLFRCDNFDKNKNYGELKIVRGSSLKINCEYHGSYGGEIINFEIDHKLKIINPYYYYDNYDTTGGFKEEYLITNIEIIMNKNPLRGTIDDFQGKIMLNGKVKRIYESFYEFSETEKFTFVGYFICK